MFNTLLSHESGKVALLIKRKVMSRRDCLECGGLKVNLNKAKMMMSDGNHGFVEKCDRWPCSVYGRDVSRNSIWCNWSKT